MCPIVIGLPDECFNPSLIRHGDGLLCAYRDSNKRLQTHIRMVRLDGTLHALPESSAVHPLPGPHDAPIWEDPRLFRFRDRLFCSFTVWGKTVGGHRTSVGVAELNEAARAISVRFPAYGFNGNLWSGTHHGGQEKNWVFFEFQGRLHFLYGAEPFEVVEYDYDRDRILASTCTYRNPRWAWGAIRGGTPPILHDGRFVTFFHSSAWVDDWLTPPVSGEPRKHLVYHMGVLTFRAELPFRIDQISRRPLVSGWRESGCEKSVIFPGGAVLQDDGWLVACGENDRRCVIHHFTHAEIAASLRPFDEVPPHGNDFPPDHPAHRDALRPYAAGGAPCS